MNDDFLSDFREDPRPEFTQKLWGRLQKIDAESPYVAAIGPSASTDDGTTGRSNWAWAQLSPSREARIISLLAWFD